jgi:RNA polymerase sigma-70 factor, ECF subfamily
MSAHAPRFVELLELARASHPELAVDDATFVAFLEHRFRTAELDDASAERNAGDLLLACAALANVPLAVAELERHAIASLDPALVSIVGAEGVDEVKQRVREALLVVTPPRLTSYAGRGPLRAWVRAVAVRIALRMRGEAARTVELDPDILGDRADPALRLLREQYSAELRAAFEAALASLSPRDRTLLRQQYVDGLGIEALAAVHQVHRVTMFRWLGKIRHALLAETRRQLARKIQIVGTDLDSLMRAVQSGVELTLERILPTD